MNQIKSFLAGLMLATAATATAGGILTNTNQSVDFLRNPARDAAIGLDGVYSNPAGVAFMPDGLHLAFNWQYAHQTRTVNTTHSDFAFGKRNGGNSTKTFEGVANAPIIPSLQAAYNKGDWSFQFNFSVPGGGGKCEFADGLGSFESVVAGISQQLGTLTTTLNGSLQQQGSPMLLPVAHGYDMDGYMQGKQYYFGVQLGAAYKINEHLSVYGGLRLLYGDASYKAKISNIKVLDANNTSYEFAQYLDMVSPVANAALQQVETAIQQLEAAGAEVPAALLQQQAGLQSVQTLQVYREGVNLQCDQHGLGIAPVLGVDYKIGRFNFAAKYEFRTQMKMKNKSTLDDGIKIEEVQKFRDGAEIDEDSPALLTLGAQWSPIDAVRINAGYHHFYDKNVKWYGNTQDKLGGGTNEYLAGVEWDITDRLTVSTGCQLTRYQLTDDYMNDISFVTPSYSIGFGLSYKVSNAVKLSAAYFQTNYETYKMDCQPAGLNNTTHNEFTRTNYVLGAGVEVTL